MTFPNCDYASPDDQLTVNYHFDADTMTVYPVDHPAVVAFLDGGATIAAYITPEPYTPPTPDPQPFLYAVAHLSIADSDIASLNITAKLAGAFRFDVGQYWVFFTEEQPDTSYMALAYDSGTVRAFVAESDKFTSYFVITTTDFSGTLADPAEINLEIKRVS